MAADPTFPRLLTEMTGVGERSGNMEQTLTVIGDYFDNEVSVTTQRLLSLMEPVRVLRRRGVPVPAAAAQQEQYQQ